MFFYLDQHPTKCASMFHIDHLKPQTIEVVQLLSDVTRVLIEECRVYTLEKKMRDPRAEVQPESYYAELERRVPMPLRYGPNDGLVKWGVEGQDSWDWLLQVAYDLVNEQKDWYGKGPSDEVRRAVHWLQVDAPRPIHAGRIRPRTSPFPIHVDLPKECLETGPGAKDGNQPEWAYRKYYFLKYRNTVQFTSVRRPWWWAALERNWAPTLASRPCSG